MRVQRNNTLAGFQLLHETLKRKKIVFFKKKHVPACKYLGIHLYHFHVFCIKGDDLILQFHLLTFMCNKHVTSADENLKLYYYILYYSETMQCGVSERWIPLTWMYSWLDWCCGHNINAPPGKSRSQSTHTPCTSCGLIWAILKDFMFLTDH